MIINLALAIGAQSVFLISRLGHRGGGGIILPQQSLSSRHPEQGGVRCGSDWQLM